MKTGWIIVGLLALVTVALIFWYGIFRFGNGTGHDVNVLAASTVTNDFVTTGRDVRIQTEIGGDLTAAGSSVTVAAPVKGYAMLAGRRVTVQQQVGNDLWAAAETITLNGAIGDNARLAARSIVFNKTASVEGRTQMAAQTIYLDGRLNGDVTAAAQEMQVSGEMDGTLKVHAQRVRLLQGAVVRGDLLVYSPAPPQISNESKVFGSVRYYKQVEKGEGVLGWLGRWIFLFVALFLIGAACIAISDLWTSRVSRKITRRPAHVLLFGVLGLIVFPLVALALIVTVVGIPLAIVIIALYAVSLLLSGVFVSYLLGGWLIGKMNRPHSSAYARFAVGAAVVSLCCSLPLIGPFIQLAVVIAGFGALLLQERDALRPRMAQGRASA